MPRRQHAVKSKLRSPAGEALSGVAFRVLRLAGLLLSAGDRLAAPMGQSSARWQVMAAVEAEPASVAHIARALGLARQSVQRVADLLARDGLVAYDDNPEHARAKLVRLTPSGRTTLTAIQTAQRAWANELGAEVGEAELSRAIPALDGMLAALQRREPE